MSVINQMLKDLEQRDQRARAELQPAGTLHSHVPAGGARPRRMLGLGVGVLFLLLAATGYLLMSPSALSPVSPQGTHIVDGPVAEPIAVANQPLDSVAVVVDTAAEKAPDLAQQLAQVAQQSVPVAPIAARRPEAGAMAPAAAAVQSAAPVVADPSASRGQAVVPAAEKPAPASAGEIKPGLAKDIPPPPVAIKEVKLTQDQLAQSKYNKALAALEAGKITAAESLLDQALAIKPDMTPARARLASLYYGQQNNAQAVTVLQQGLALQPGNVEYRLMLARLFQQGKNDTQALSYLNQGAQPPASDVDFHALRGALAQQQKHYLIAAESYQLLAQYQPEQGRWWLGWGIAADAQGQSAIALQAFRQALASGSLSAAAVGYAEQRLQQLGGE